MIIIGHGLDTNKTTVTSVGAIGGKGRDTRFTFKLRVSSYVAVKNVQHRYLLERNYNLNSNPICVCARRKRLGEQSVDSDMVGMGDFSLLDFHRIEITGDEIAGVRRF